MFCRLWPLTLMTTSRCARRRRGLSSALGRATVEKSASQVSKPELSKEKQTTSRLYLTAKGAYEKWSVDSEKVRILDVRTTEEHSLSAMPRWCGTSSPSADVSVGRQQEEAPHDAQPGFRRQSEGACQARRCAWSCVVSGGRSAQAVNRLAEAGFRNVYNIVDGMEGDVVGDPESVFQPEDDERLEKLGVAVDLRTYPDRMKLPKGR